MKMKRKSFVSCDESRDILRRLVTPPQMEWGEGENYRFLCYSYRGTGGRMVGE